MRGAPMPKGYLFLLVPLLMPCSPVARADKLTITSTPQGATVEIDSVKVGKTPFVRTIPVAIFAARKRLSVHVSSTL